MRRGLTRCTTGLVVLMAALCTLLAVPALADAGTESAEAEFVQRINDLRSGKGLAPLKVNAELTSIGRRWSATMAANGSISHNPDFPNWVSADWTKLGENVGVGPRVSTLHEAFVNSPGHYKNLVEPSFTHVGVGVVVTGDGTMFTSHQFMTLKTAVPAPVAPPTTAKPAPRRPAAATAPTTMPQPRAGSSAGTTGANGRPPPVPALPAVPSDRLVDVLRQLHALDVRT